MGNAAAVRQVGRFLLVGVLCALVDSGCYVVLLQVGTWVHAAKSISFALGTTAAFFLNRRFTFGVTPGGARQIGGFALLYAATFIVNVCVNALSLHVLPPFRLEYAISWLVAQGLATVVNFVVLRTVVFRVGKPGGVGHQVVG